MNRTRDLGQHLPKSTLRTSPTTRDKGQGANNAAKELLEVFMLKQATSPLFLATRQIFPTPANSSITLRRPFSATSGRSSMFTRTTSMMNISQQWNAWIMDTQSNFLNSKHDTDMAWFEAVLMHAWN